VTNRSLRTFPAALAVLLAAGTAAAEPQDFPVERMRATLDSDGIIAVESGTVPGHLRWSAGLWLGYSANPLVVRRTDTGERLGSLVERRAGGSLVASIGLASFAQLGLELPFAAYQDRGAEIPGATTRPLDALAGAGLGDLRIVPKIGLLRSEGGSGFDLAVLAPVTLPTSGGQAYLGASALSFQPELAATYRTGGWRIGANVGLPLRQAQQFLSQKIESELLVGAGVARRFWTADDRKLPLELAASLTTGTSILSPFANATQAPTELRAQGTWWLSPDLSVFAGAGGGIVPGWGTPDWRAFVGLRFEPAPVQDRDGDGIPDDKDGCPDVAEDKDGFDDADGCPDPDNDGDGILDADDRCPLVKGVAREKGCPESDRDRDTVIDRLDICPDDAGKDEFGGCTTKQLVALKDGRIEILEAVYFKLGSDVIEERSHALLDNIVAVLKSHPDIKRVLVEGHTDNQGSAASNVDLSQRRAGAVRSYLMGKGIVESRLEAKGFGQDQPIATNDTEEGRARNRRVVFTLPDEIDYVKQGTQGPGADTIEQKKGGK
jgi:outer membrane protein OmpA-like peptidoglycan-associated protein